MTIERYSGGGARLYVDGNESEGAGDGTILAARAEHLE